MKEKEMKQVGLLIVVACVLFYVICITPPPANDLSCILSGHIIMYAGIARTVLDIHKHFVLAIFQLSGFR